MAQGSAKIGFVGFIFLFLATHSQLSGAAVLKLSGTFIGYFDPGSPNEIFSGDWTATIDTNAAVGTSKTVTVAPDTLNVYPNPIVPDPIPASFATFSTANTSLSVTLGQITNVPVGVLLTGNNFNFTTFNAGYFSQNQSVPAAPTIYVVGYKATTTIGTPPVQYVATTFEGSMSWTESLNNLVLSSDQIVSFSGGASGGGLSMQFLNGYEGGITVDPFPTSSDYDSPNFLLAWGGSDAKFWKIQPLSTFDGLVELSFSYDETSLLVPEESLAVYHFSSLTGQWEELASFVDTENNIVTARTSNFSVFTLGLVSPINNVSEPAVLWLFSLGLLAIAWQRRRPLRMSTR